MTWGQPRGAPRGTVRGRRAALNCWRHAGTAARKKVMLAHGFDIPLMVELVRDGLATARPERLRAGKVEMEIARVRITEAGRRETRWLSSDETSRAIAAAARSTRNAT